MEADASVYSFSALGSNAGFDMSVLDRERSLNAAF